MLIFNMAYKRDTLLSSEKKEELSDKVLTEMDEQSKDLVKDLYQKSLKLLEKNKKALDVLSLELV